MKCSRGETRRETFPSLTNSCTTYDVKTLTEKPPCRSCCDLFSFEPVNHNLREHIYGNCAEVEAISKLLRFNGTPHFENCTEWDFVRDQTKCDLMRRLQEVNCKFNIDVVYEPTSTFRPRDWGLLSIFHYKGHSHHTKKCHYQRIFILETLSRIVLFLDVVFQISIQLLFDINKSFFLSPSPSLFTHITYYCQVIEVILLHCIIISCTNLDIIQVIIIHALRISTNKS